MKNKNWRSVGWCEVHFKHLYASRGAAKKVCRLHQGEHKSPFLCGPAHPDLWHIGGLSPAVVTGTFSRSDIYG